MNLVHNIAHIRNRIAILFRMIGQKLDMFSALVVHVRNRRCDIEYGGVTYSFSVPNYLCQYRVDTYSTKEPETLTWIDSFFEKSIFWDVGANIGLYSIYAAKNRGCRVWSFEPSVFNLEVLARNIDLNALSSNVFLMPIAIGEKTGIGLLHLSSTDWGGALSTFDKTFGFDGKPLKQVFEYATYAVTLDDAVDKLDLPTPDFLKIDVDGIEHLILAGGGRMLRSVKSVLVEISNEFEEQGTLSRKYLEAAGLVLVETDYDNLARKESQQCLIGTVNQIWTRK
jgi:FkbM family methyltransferase